MLVYFSATNNTRYVANKIASSLNERLFDIDFAPKNKILTFDIQKGEKLIFLAPVYFLSMPFNVTNFIERSVFNVQKNTSVYFIATLGLSQGQVHRLANKLLKRKNICLRAFFAVKMVDTFTPMFSVKNIEKNEAIEQQADIQIAKIIRSIQNNTSKSLDIFKIPSPISKIYTYLSLKKTKTKDFKVLDNCIRCGLCEKNCPTNTIKLQKNISQIHQTKPVWQKDKCLFCLRCLHYCPTFSIQFGNKTQYHGQYKHK